MNEFEKNQDKNQDGGDQGGKPAFDQFDKGQGQQDQQEFGQKGEQIDKGQQEQDFADEQGDGQFNKDQGGQQR